MEALLEQHSAELMILALTVLLLGTLLILVPKLLRVRNLIAEMQHQEHLRALEQGQPLPVPDERSSSAGAPQRWCPWS